MKNKPVARTEEQIIFALRDLYEAYGYSQFKMTKFEEYDFYARNKNFLVSDNVITFTDTNGKLMALKPDVTLSIIRNTDDVPDEIRKVYYNENVYRVSKNSHSFREIMQTGIECLGDVDSYNIAEILNLAASSLKLISDESILSITDLDVLFAAVDACGLSPEAKEKAMCFIGEKNSQSLAALLESEGVSRESAENLLALSKLRGTPTAVIAEIKKLMPGFEGIKAFENIIRAIHPALKDMIEIDFSYSGDVSYYNGITFKGFINGIPESVISGGQYDRLMETLGKKSKAIGFAVYLGTLERLGKAAKYDVNTVVLYRANANVAKLSAAVKAIADTGVSVVAMRKVPEKLRYKRLMKFNGKEAEPVETDA